MKFLMHHYLEQSAEAFPGKEALVQGDRRYSFREYNQVCAGLAGMLRQGGFSCMDRVGVFLDHSIDQVFSFFGILKAGGVYVPINSLLLSRQVQHIAQDSEFTALILDDKRLDMLKEHIPEWRFLKCLVVSGTIPEWTKDLNLTVLPFENALNSRRDTVQHEGSPCIGADLAALLYTSGSTGKPKGVMVSHDNLIAGAKIVTSYLQNKHDDRLLGVLPLSFDAGLNQVTCSAYLGMTYVMKSFRFPGELVKELLREKITGFAGIPTIWLLLLQTGSSVYKHEFPNLRYITNTGGTLPLHAVDKLKQVFNSTQVVLMYGLTEAFRSTYLPPDMLDTRPTSMGKAIPGVEILVVDKNGNQCSSGEVGELVHRGPTVSMGYWNNPEKTRQVFRPNHFLPPGMEATERIVFSGDLVKKDEHGFLYFVSRDDHMIKCHGHRISPAEIEEVLYASGGIKLCAAVGLPDPIRGQTIKIYATLQDGAELDTEDVMNMCAEVLPAFMLPKEVTFLEEMPRTATGKIDIAFLKQNSQ